MDRKSLNALKKVTEIKEYCETYKEWPKQYTHPQNEKEKISSRLNDWLNKNGFFSQKYQFEFEFLKFPTGELIINILNELYDTYCLSRNNHRTKTYITKKVEEITDFCCEYHNWPYFYENPSSKREIISTILSHWLVSSLYYTEDFKYQAFKLESGEYVSTILNDLYQKYFYNSKETLRITDMFKDLIAYCKKYETWLNPIANPLTLQDELASKISCDFKFYMANLAIFQNLKCNQVINYYQMLYKDYTPSPLNSAIFTLANLFIKLSEVMYTDFSQYNTYRTQILQIITDQKLNLDFQAIALIFTKPYDEQIMLLFSKYHEITPKIPEGLFYQTLLKQLLNLEDTNFLKK